MPKSRVRNGSTTNGEIDSTAKWAAPRLENKQNIKFFIPYPEEKDFAVQAGSGREKELIEKKTASKNKVFKINQFTGLSPEQILQNIVFGARIKKKPCLRAVTTTTKTTDIIEFKDGNVYINGVKKNGNYGLTETAAPTKFTIERKFFCLNELEKPLKALEAKLKEYEFSPKERLSRALDSLGTNTTLASIKTKYSSSELTPTYALYCLEQELLLIKEQINAYVNETNELRSQLEIPGPTNMTPAENFIINAKGAIKVFRVSGKIPEMAEDFRTQFGPIIEDVNAVEKLQTSKTVDRLLFAEKFPAIKKFESQILTESELLEVMRNSRLSGQQADLLHQIEDVIMHDNTRSKVRGLLDTGMGKTFLAEKIAQYSKILKRENRNLPENFPRIASFEIKNIDLANQEQLLEMESRGSRNDKPLKGELIIVDEDFFISKKSLRTLVDKGAKVVRFGASENKLQLIEAFHRAEEKNSVGAEIKKNEALIKMLENKKDENNKLIEIYRKLSSSYQRITEDERISHMLQSFNREEFKEAIDKLVEKGLIKKEEVEECWSRVDPNFNGRSQKGDRSNRATEVNIKKMITAAYSIPQIEISQALWTINETRSSAKEFKNAYAELKRLGVFEGLSEEIDVSLPEVIEQRAIKSFKTKYLPAIKYAAEKKILSLNGLESNQDIKDEGNNLSKGLLYSSYLNGIGRDIDTQISTIRAKNEELRKSNQIFDSKVKIRKNDVEAVAERRDLAKKRLKEAEVVNVSNDWWEPTIENDLGDKNWWEHAIENDLGGNKKSQNIFPGLSLGEVEIKTGLKEILKQTGKDVAVANFVKDGKHKIILAKKNAKGSIEHTVIENDGNKDDRIAELAKGTTSSVMIYAGEQLEFVVGGDYGPLSILAEGDRQNIFIKREEDLNIDLFKQMFGRDRGGVENISRRVILIGEVAKGKEAAELADESFANSQKKDLSTMQQSLQTKLKKYYKENRKSEKLVEMILRDISKNGAKEIVPLIVNRAVLADWVNKQSNFLIEGVDKEKFRRDLKAFAFYSLAEQAVDQKTECSAAFNKISLEGFTASEELKNLIKTSDVVLTLDNLEIFSELLHLKEEVKPEIKSTKLDELRKQLDQKQELLSEAAGNEGSLAQKGSDNANNKVSRKVRGNQEVASTSDQQKQKENALKQAADIERGKKLKAAQKEEAPSQELRAVQLSADKKTRKDDKMKKDEEAGKEANLQIETFGNSLNSPHAALIETKKHPSIEEIVKVSDNNEFEIDNLKPDFEILEGDSKGKHEVNIVNPVGDETANKAFIAGVVRKDSDDQTPDLNKELDSESLKLRDSSKTIDESSLEFSGISNVVKSVNDKEVQSGESLTVTGVKNGETELSADEIDKPAKAIEAEKAAITSQIIKEQASKTIESVMQASTDDVKEGNEQGLNSKKAAQSILKTPRDNANLNKCSSSEQYYSNDVSQRGSFSEEDSKDIAAGEVEYEEAKKVLLEHEAAAIQKSHQPLTDSEVASKIKLIAKNDLHNLGESTKPEKNRKTEFFNSDKVMRTLAKVHAISELRGEKMDLEEWKKVWGLDRLSNLNLTLADKAILAMLGMNDEGVKMVFGSIEKPQLALGTIDDIKLENIMNVASKLIAAIEPEELKKYSGKEVETSNGIKKIISDKLGKGVAGRSLSFDSGTPQPSVEKPQAWKVSLVMPKSRTIVGVKN